MSGTGVYSALSGAIAQNQKLETIANNLANVNTPSFKRDQQVFQEYLTSYEKPPEVIQVPRVPASIESFYDMQGGDTSYVDTAGTVVDHSQGGLKQTGNLLDLAIEGEGLFEVLSPDGIRYTRNGAFLVNGQGQLVTKEGYPVLRQGTGEPEQRTFQVQGRNITISWSGSVVEDGINIGKLAITKAGNKDALQKVGSSLFTLKPNMDAALTPAADYKIHQGYLEMSNVNIIREMTDMISTNRTFEGTQKVIQAFDRMDDKLMNAVPSLR